MPKPKFSPNPNTSYSAGVAYLILKPDSAPQIILILQKAGEKNILKGGGAFIEKRTWKMPMGHFDHKKDADLIDTAIREFQEETGRDINRNELSLKNSIVLKIKSDRPGYEFHEDRFFLAISRQEPSKNPKIKLDSVIEYVSQFPLDALPLDQFPAQNATLARGQRRKLSAILLSCETLLAENGINRDFIGKTLTSLSK